MRAPHAEAIKLRYYRSSFVFFCLFLPAALAAATCAQSAPPQKHVNSQRLQSTLVKPADDRDEFVDYNWYDRSVYLMGAGCAERFRSGSARGLRRNSSGLLSRTAPSPFLPCAI